MTSSTAKVYLDLLNVSPVPLTVQRRIHHWASIHREEDVLTRLASIASLEPEIDAQLAECDLLEVLIAWSQRPGRSDEELIARLSREKRATVLAQIAGRDGLHEDVYRSLGLHKAVTLRWTLLANQAVPHDLRVTLAKGLTPEFRKHHRGATAMLLNAIGNDVALWNIFLADIRSGSTVDGALTKLEVIDPVMQMNIVTFTLPNLRNGDSWWAISALESLSKRVDLDAKAAEKLLEGCEAALESTTISRHYTGSRVKSIIQRLQTRPTGDLDQMLEAIRDAGDPATLENAVADYVKLTSSLRIDGRALATAIVENEHCTPSLVEDHFLQLAEGDRDRHIVRFEREGRNELLRTVVLNCVGPRHALVVVTDKALVLEMALKGLSDARPGWYLNGWYENIYDEELIDEHFELFRQHLPIRLLLGNPLCAAKAMGVITEALGENLVAWELFEALVGDYTDNLDSLLSTVNHLNG